MIFCSTTITPIHISIYRLRFKITEKWENTHTHTEQKIYIIKNAYLRPLFLKLPPYHTHFINTHHVFSNISHFLERILIEHKWPKTSLDCELQIDFVCSEKWETINTHHVFRVLYVIFLRFFFLTPHPAPYFHIIII